MSETELREALTKFRYQRWQWGMTPSLDELRDVDRLLASIPAEPEQADEVAGLDEDLDWAWSIIANAGGGNWNRENSDWRAAAERWRDHVLPGLSARRAARLAPARDDTP